MRALVALVLLTAANGVIAQVRTVTPPPPPIPRVTAPKAAASIPAEPPAPVPDAPSDVPPSGDAPGPTVVPNYSMPYAGWSAKDASTWGADSGACLVREEKYDQTFPAFPSLDAAQKFAVRLQQVLYARKLGAVVTQPVERAGSWGVLASYQFTSDGSTYKVTQLYLSDSGKLRTFTGSARDDTLDQCVNDMLSFVRYLAN